jgi:hypothetical protein
MNSQRNDTAAFLPEKRSLFLSHRSLGGVKDAAMMRNVATRRQPNADHLIPLLKYNGSSSTLDNQNNI